MTEYVPIGAPDALEVIEVELDRDILMRSWIALIKTKSGQWWSCMSLSHNQPTTPAIGSILDVSQLSSLGWTSIVTSGQIDASVISAGTVFGTPYPNPLEIVTTELDQHTLAVLAWDKYRADLAQLQTETGYQHEFLAEFGDDTSVWEPYDGDVWAQDELVAPLVVNHFEERI